MSEKHHQNICKWDLVLFPSSHRTQWCKRFKKRRLYGGDKLFFFYKNIWTPFPLDNTLLLLSRQRQVACSHPIRPVARYIHPFCWLLPLLLVHHHFSQKKNKASAISDGSNQHRGDARTLHGAWISDIRKQRRIPV